jgi:hypothetical protein
MIFKLKIADNTRMGMDDDKHKVVTQKSLQLSLNPSQLVSFFSFVALPICVKIMDEVLNYHAFLFCYKPF